MRPFQHMQRLLLSAAAVTGIGALLLATGSPAQDTPLASQWVQAPNARLRLIGAPGPSVWGASNVSAGTATIIGIEMELAPGWKTYWRMPGDAGVPPFFDFKPSKNLGSAVVSYPVPKRMADETGQFLGYTSHVLFPLTITSADPSRSVELKLEMQFGVCKDVCIPADVTLALEVPAVGAPGATPKPVPASIAQALEATPRTKRRATDPELIAVKPITASGTLAASQGTLVIIARGATDAFVEAPDGIFVPLPTIRAATSGAKADTVFEIDLAKAPDIKDAIGKPLTITLVGPNGASETTWTAK